MRGEKSGKKGKKRVRFDQSVWPSPNEEVSFIEGNKKLLNQMNLESPRKNSYSFKNSVNLTRLNDFHEHSLVKRLQYDEDKLKTSLHLS